MTTPFPILETNNAPVWNLDVPGIYAIEITAACDLACPMCLRTTSQLPDKKPTLFDADLLQVMYDRGDFSGSSYVELQLAGEPTIHPELERIIQFLSNKVGVLTGLSTHGHNMAKRYNGKLVADILCQLDSLTISVDSLDPAIYAQMRYPKHLPDLLRNIRFFAHRFRWLRDQGAPVPQVDLQLVNTKVVSGSGDLIALEAFIYDEDLGDVFSPRMISDCFNEMNNFDAPGSQPRSMQMCLNPFMSVNISQDADVVSCCYVFYANESHINYYGNLKTQSLQDIWNGPRANAMRQSHYDRQLKDFCSKCFLYSPVLLHHRFVSRLVRSQTSRNKAR